MKHRVLFALLELVVSTAVAADCGDGLKVELAQRFERDQAVRKTLLANPTSKEAQAEALRTDADNTAFMRSVLARCGWPKRSELGEEAAKAAWFLTQHADMDPDYQVQAARQMKHAVLAGEAEPKRLALLVDRNRRLTDQPQVYGMQTYRDGDTLRFFHIVAPRQLDERRREIGLSAFYCWAHELAAANPGVTIEWPAGVLFMPESCAGMP